MLADKLPGTSSGEPVAKALLLSFKARAGHESQVAQFLRDAQALVEQEPRTVAWFAIRFDDGHFGIFDVFPDNSGRFAHLTGHVPRELDTGDRKLHVAFVVATANYRPNYYSIHNPSTLPIS